MELRTAKRSPARPLTNSRPPVAPYRHVLPTSDASSAAYLWPAGASKNSSHVTGLLGPGCTMEDESRRVESRQVELRSLSPGVHGR